MASGPFGHQGCRVILTRGLLLLLLDDHKSWVEQATEIDIIAIRLVPLIITKSILVHLQLCLLVQFMMG